MLGDSDAFLFIPMHMGVILFKMCNNEETSLRAQRGIFFLKKYQAYSNIVDKYVSLAKFLVGKSWNLVVYFDSQIVVPQHIFTFGLSPNY